MKNRTPRILLALALALVLVVITLPLEVIATEVPADNYIATTKLNTSTDNSTELANPILAIEGGSYDAFGFLCQPDSDTIIYIFTRGTGHGGFNKSVWKAVYTLSTKTWDTPSHIYSTYGVADSVSGGIIGENIYVFLSRWENSLFKDIGFIKSTDLTGSSWSGFTEIETGLTHPNARAASNYQITSTSINGTYLVGFWQQELGDPCIVESKVFKTTNYGDNWTMGSLINEGWKTGEPTLASIGDNKIIALMRNNDSSRTLQSISDDNGETWSELTNTNLGLPNTEGARISNLLYDSETDEVIVIYGNRPISDNMTSIIITSGDADTVFNDPTAYGNFETVDSENYWFVTYPCIVKIASGQYFYTYSKEVEGDERQCDTWAGYYPPLEIESEVEEHYIDGEGNWAGKITVIYTSDNEPALASITVTTVEGKEVIIYLPEDTGAIILSLNRPLGMWFEQD